MLGLHVVYGHQVRVGVVSIAMLASTALDVSSQIVERTLRPAVLVKLLRIPAALASTFLLVLLPVYLTRIGLVGLTVDRVAVLLGAADLSGSFWLEFRRRQKRLR